MTSGPSSGNGGIESDHLGADHRHGFALGRIDLARHDRTAGLIGRQQEFPQASAWPTGEKTNVIGYFQQADRQAAQLSHGLNQAVVPGHHSKQIVGRVKSRCCSLSQSFRHSSCEARWCIQPTADGCASKRERQHVLSSLVEPFPALTHLIPPGTHLITQAKGHCILEVGASDFDDVHPALGLGVKAGDQSVQFRQQCALQLEHGRHMNRCRESIVGRLGPVDMVIGVDRVMASQVATGFHRRQVADHLIDVHVRLGAAAGLPDA